MKIQRNTNEYRYFDETVFFEFGSRQPSLRDTIRKQNAEWLLIEFSVNRSDKESEKARNGLFIEKRWAHKKDYEKIYHVTKIFISKL